MAAGALVAMLARLVLPFLLVAAASGAGHQELISRRSFPEGFVFGTASSSYQVLPHSIHSCITFLSSALRENYIYTQVKHIDSILGLIQDKPSSLSALWNVGFWICSRLLVIYWFGAHCACSMRVVQWREAEDQASGTTSLTSTQACIWYTHLVSSSLYNTKCLYLSCWEHN